MDIEERITALAGWLQDRYGFIYAVARRYAPPDQAEDVVQQVYLEFVTGFQEGQWSLDRNHDPLLYTIAKRKAQTLWKEYRRRSGSSIDEVADQLIDSCEADGDVAENEYIDLQISALKNCLKKMSPKHRAVVEQHYFQKVPIKEIARQQQIKDSTIYHLFSRMRLQLRDCIERAVAAYQHPES